MENKFSNYLSIDYNFSIDNNFDRFEYNSVNTNFNLRIWRLVLIS